MLITELLTRESQFPDNVSLVILFNNINLFLLLVQHGPRESEGSPDVLQAIGGGLLHVLVLRPDQLE